jgi:DNA-3-methyladenine glycosylase
MELLNPEKLRSKLALDVLAATPDLLGWFLIRGPLRARIVEVEAYRTPDDPGCHAHHGETPRLKAMFGEPGHAYVYFTYGNHWMLNVTAHEPGIAAAALIRAAEPLEGLEIFRERRPKAKRDEDLLSGPGKLAAAFSVDARLYGVDLLSPKSELRLEPGAPPAEIGIGPRVGLSPGCGDRLPWRFADMQRLRWVSRPHSNLSKTW